MKIQARAKAAEAEKEKKKQKELLQAAEKRKGSIDEKEAELKEDEEEVERKITQASKLLEEGNTRLQEALEKKDMVCIQAAHALIEAANNGKCPNSSGKSHHVREISHENTECDHQCMSYASYKESYEMSSTNIAKYIKSLQTIVCQNETPKQSSYRPHSSLNRIVSGKSLSAMGNKSFSKYIEKNSKSCPKICLSDVNRSKLKKKVDVNKNSFNSEGKKSKLTRNLEKEDLALLNKENTISHSIIKQEDTVLVKAPLPFACNICTDSFVSQNTLDIHLKYDHRPRPTCSQCGKMFDCRRKLINHEANCASDDLQVATQSLCGIIDFISPVEVFFCVKCENPFLSKNALREHKILLNKRKPLSIELEDLPEIELPQNANYEICVKKMPSYSVVSYLDDDYNKCGYCGKSFQNLRRFKQHCAFCRKMKSIIRSRECYFCKKSFNTSKLRDRHMPFCTKMTCGYSYITNDEYICTICNIRIKCLEDFNLHLHLDHDQRYCCKCDEMYLPDTIYGLKHKCKTISKLSIPVQGGRYKTYPKRTGKKPRNKEIKRDKIVKLGRKNAKHNPLLALDLIPVKENIPLNTILNEIQPDDELVFESVVEPVVEDVVEDVVEPAVEDVVEPAVETDVVETDVEPVCEPTIPNGHSVEPTLVSEQPIDQIDQSVLSDHERRPSRINKGKNNKYSRVPAYVTNTPSFHCIFCPTRSFVYRAGLDSHMRHIHNKEQCRNCGDIYRYNERSQHTCLIIKVENEDADQVDLIEKTSSDPDLLSCTGSEKSDELSVKLDNEIVHVEPILELPEEAAKVPKSKDTTQFQCYKCSKTYVQKQNMVKHLIVHSKRHPFKCKYCQKLFKSPVSVQDHVRTVHHPSTYTHRKPLISSLIERHQIKDCHLCNNLYLGVADLKQHQKKSHDFAVLSNNERSMCSISTSLASACTICHKKCKKRKLIRTSENEVVCKKCSDAISRNCFQSFESNGVDEKSTISMALGEHVCTKCSKRYNSLKLFEEHVSSCTGEKENEMMKPLIPDKSLFAFSFDTEKPSNAIMTLEDAQATLESLDVENVQIKQEPSYNEEINSNVNAVDENQPPRNKNENENEKSTNPISLKDKENKDDEENGFRIIDSYQLFPCRECNINFDTQNSLECHLRSFHKKSTNATSPLKIQLQHDASKNTQLKVNTNSYVSPNGLNFCHPNSDSAELIPSPIGSPTFRLNSTERFDKCPFRTPCPPVQANPYLYSTRMDFAANVRVVSPKRFYRNPEQEFYSHPFKGPNIPHRKFMNYPNEYQTHLYKHSLQPSLPPMSGAKRSPNVYGSNYSPVQRRDHQELTSIESITKNLNSNTFPKMPKARRRAKRDFSEVSKSNTTSMISLTSPTRDEVVDVLKPLSPKSLDKTVPEESRRKYTKSEVAFKMTRLADTIGRKFGSRFKQNGVKVSPSE